MKYVIYNTQSKCFFEQDAMGWSWQLDHKMAFKFGSEAAAKEAAQWLKEFEITICEVEK